MSTFEHIATGVTVSVADHKDHRFDAATYRPVGAAAEATEPPVDLTKTAAPAKRAPGRPRKTTK